VQRVVALVVAPDLDRKEILAALGERINPVFLPRPLYKVDRLPRNAMGKLPHEALMGLLEKLGYSS
jgi:acyl-coenzyme A synthetase/AMP-(fatty) acid ligase